MRSWPFFFAALSIGAVVFALALLVRSDYLFFAGYTVLQFVVLATAWNILGGYCGYVNFGSAAFFALGAYTSVVFYKFVHDPRLCPDFWTSLTGQDCLLDLTASENEGLKDVLMTYLVPQSIPAVMAVAAVISGLIGLGTGYLTLRLRGAFFAIATLALAVVLQTFVVNWSYVGGARGAYVILPAEAEGLSLPYIQYLFLIMLALAVMAVVTARIVERSKLGHGFAA